MYEFVQVPTVSWPATLELVIVVISWIQQVQSWYEWTFTFDLMIKMQAEKVIRRADEVNVEIHSMNSCLWWLWARVISTISSRCTAGRKLVQKSEILCFSFFCSATQVSIITQEALKGSDYRERIGDNQKFHFQVTYCTVLFFISKQNSLNEVVRIASLPADTTVSFCTFIDWIIHETFLTKRRSMSWSAKLDEMPFLD